MARIKTLPQTAYLQVCFIYNPETGELIWRERPREHFNDQRSYMRWNTCYADTIAGSPTASGHRTVLINKTPYLIHRVAWKLMTDEEPPEIDHINGVRFDNKWKNLRAATKSQQIGNRHSLNRTNTSGFRGVSPYQGRWKAQLGTKYLGMFDTPEAANEVYEAAAREHFGEFYNSR